MSTVILSLQSQRSKPVPDRVQFIEVRGRQTGQVQPDEIDLRPAEIVMDLVPDLYTVQVVTNHEGSGADVDLDNGAFHKSSPHSIFKNFVKRFPKTDGVYEVD